MNDTATKEARKPAEAPKAQPAAPPPAPPVAAAAAGPAPKPREIRPLPVAFCRLLHDSGGDFGRIWGATIPAGTPWEHVIDDAFWAHRANVFIPHDIVWLKHANREYFAELLVLETRTVGNAVEKNRVTMHVKSKHDLKPADAGLDSYRALFEITHLGTEKKWCVVEVATKTIVHEGFATIEDAQRGRLHAASEIAKREAMQRRARGAQDA